MAAHPLPARQRRIAILTGGGAALLLRVGLTAVAALLLGLPALKAIGGILLLWIAFRLLQREHADSEAKEAHTLRDAITTILLADFVMSLDNVLGVAAAADGDIPLLMFGLVASMAIVMFGGSIIAGLIDRLWWLAYAGALVIAWTGADMIQDDDLLLQLGSFPPLVRPAISAVVSLVVVAVAWWIHRYPPASRQSAQ